METFSLLLQSGPGGSAMITNIVFIGAMLGVFYLFMIRPNAKRAREAREYLEQLEIGSKVVTNGGIHGKIVQIHEDGFSVKIDKNTQIKIDKDCVNLERSKRPEDEATEGK